MSSFEGGYDGGAEDYGDGWGDQAGADLTDFQEVVDPMYDSGIIPYEPEEATYTPMRPLPGGKAFVVITPEGDKKPREKDPQPVQQDVPVPRKSYAGDKPLTAKGSSRATVAVVATFLALGTATTAVNAFGERGGIESEIEHDFRGENFLGDDTNTGCLDDTPYASTEIKVTGVLSPGQTAATIESADPALPDLEFESYGTGSGRVVEPADEYSDTFVRYHDCHGSYSGE